MSEGNTLSLYPSSAASPTHFPTPPHHHQTATMNINTGVGVGGIGSVPIVSADHNHSSDEEKTGKGRSPKNGGGSGPGGKSRRELPAGAVATLKAWLLSPEHFTHPYPTPQDQIMLMHKTGIDKKQLKNWFTNARRRIWKPMLKKQLEAGKLAATAAGGAAVHQHAVGVVGGAGATTATLTTVNGVTPISAGGQQQQVHLGSGGMSVAVPAGLSMGVPQPELSGSQPQQQQQPPQQEMFTNFQQAAQQQMQGDPNQQQQVQPQYQQQQQQQQQYQQQGQVQYDQNAGQIQQQPVQYDQYGNQVYDPTYQPPPQYQQQPQDGTATNQQQHQQQQLNTSNPNQFPISNSIGSLAPMNPTSSLASMTSFGSKMIKTDSHAVLMELFARDQDLVRQAAGAKGSGGNAQQVPQQQAHAAAAALASVNSSSINNNGATRSLQSSGLSGNLRWANGTAGPGIAGGVSSPSNMGQKQHSVKFEGVPSLSSWPHFSSVSSLNNLGGLQGVKSITNLSAADLSSQGNLNKMGNLAQVKSIENMGRGDSFAFLEVFFDDKSGMSISNHSDGTRRGVKREREYDDAIGLSLDGDDGASPGQQQFSNKHTTSAEQGPSNASSALAESGPPAPAPLPEDGKDNVDGGGNDETSSCDGGKLKRAYDDALAARGLIAVRRSCEKLTDLALPAKMQRTLSQEYIRQHNQGQPMGDFFSTNNSAYAPSNHNRTNNGSSQQQQQPATTTSNPNIASLAATLSDPNLANAASVEVPSSTICALCTEVNVDTQLRPCGHMFHGRCLKPSLQNATGPPKCPICHTPMQSAILAVPSGTAASTEGAAGAGAIAGAVGATGSVGAMDTSVNASS